MPSDHDTPIAALRERVAAFAQERDWDQFHSPKNLAMALAVEVGELLELFQWKTEEQSRAVKHPVSSVGLHRRRLKHRGVSGRRGKAKPNPTRENHLLDLLNDPTSTGVRTIWFGALGARFCPGARNRSAFLRLAQHWWLLQTPDENLVRRFVLCATLLHTAEDVIRQKGRFSDAELRARLPWLLSVPRDLRKGYFPSDGALAQRMHTMWLAARGLLDLWRVGEVWRSRLRICESRDCPRPFFIDASRRRHARWCPDRGEAHRKAATPERAKRARRRRVIYPPLPSGPAV